VVRGEGTRDGRAEKKMLHRPKEAGPSRALANSFDFGGFQRLQATTVTIKKQEKPSAEFSEVIGC
jgi:hypothetical protein